MILNKKKKIFIGLDDTASQIRDWDLGFKQNGYKTLKVIHSKDSIFKRSKVDFVVDRFKKKKNWFGYFKPGRISVKFKPWWDRYIENYIWNKAKRECDVYIFIWSSFRFDSTDQEELKAAGKKIINVLVGDEVRWFYAMQQEFALFNIPKLEYGAHYDIQSASALEHRISRLRYAEKYSDLIIFLQAPTQAQLGLRPFYSLPILLKTDEIQERNEQRQIPLVLHAPSNSALKGTKYVLETFERLKMESVGFAYKLVENLPNMEILKEYTNADILVGQVLIPGGGKQEMEALAAGCVVMSSIYPQYPQKYYDGSPIIPISPETVYQELKKIILDYPKRKELAKRGRPFVEKVHNPRLICKRVLEILDIPEEKRIFDYSPDFFRTKFIPEPDRIAVYNKWTEFVKDCEWYKKTIPPGEREGLKF